MERNDRARKNTQRPQLINAAAALFLAIFCASAAAGQQPAASPSPTPAIRRWLNVETISLAVRNRYSKPDSDRPATHSLQYQAAVRARFKFDAEGRYSVVGDARTGSTWTGSWNNTGIGSAAGQRAFSLKQLYFEAIPVKGLDIQVGGLGVRNGINTEITGYDNDGYLVGGRISLKFPKRLYFDEVSVTSAYLGDFKRPNVFRRFHRFGRSNFHQFMVVKNFGDRVEFSADYANEDGRDMLRQAVAVKVPEAKVVDNILFENYERVDPDAGYGYNLQADKKIGKKFKAIGGFTHLDQPMLTSDRFSIGNRFHLAGIYNINSEFAVSGWWVQGIGPLPAGTERTRLNFMLSYNVLPALRRMRIF